jgi:hypothetical protein
LMALLQLASVHIVLALGHGHALSLASYDMTYAQLVRGLVHRATVKERAVSVVQMQLCVQCWWCKCNRVHKNPSAFTSEPASGQQLKSTD